VNPGGMSNLGATFLDALVASLERTSDYNRNDMAAPAVVLWTDAGQTLRDGAPPRTRTTEERCC
jgi:hypothetical protein